jgi:hypothetical protein
MKAFYSDTFVLPLPEQHRFPMAKYRLLRERLVEEGILSADDLHWSTTPVTWTQSRRGRCRPMPSVGSGSRGQR